MEKTRLWLGRAKAFLSDSDKRRYVLLVVGFLVPLFWFAVEFDGVVTDKASRKKLRAGAYTTTVIGTRSYMLPLLSSSCF
jgi:hypothetical protein